MTRRQVIGFVVVLALIALGLALKPRTTEDKISARDLEPLRAAANLAPCPPGLGSEVAVVGVDTEDDPKQALTFAAQYGMRYPSLVDDKRTVLRTVSSGPPVTLFLDAAGHITYRKRGQFASLAEMQRLVATQLGVTL